MIYSAAIRIAKKSGLRYLVLMSGRPRSKRSTIKIREAGGAVSISINAKDLAALHASINSVMRDIKVIHAAASVSIQQKRKT